MYLSEVVLNNSNLLNPGHYGHLELLIRMTGLGKNLDVDLLIGSLFEKGLFAL